MSDNNNNTQMDVDDDNDPNNSTNNLNDNNMNDNDDDDDLDFNDDDDADFDDDDADFDDDNDNDNGWADDNKNDNKNDLNDNDDDDDDWPDLTANDNIIDTSLAVPQITKQASLVVSLTQDDIFDKMQYSIKTLAEELDLSDKKCLLLLRRYKWNATKIIDVYFNDPTSILVGAGVCVDPPSSDQLSAIKSKKMMECGICMDDVLMINTFHLDCGHINTCRDCWVDYLRDAVQTKLCVHLTCPTHKCYVTIEQDIWKMFIANDYPDEYARYLRFCNENFIECSKEYAFCPGKNCDMIYTSAAGVAKEIVCKTCKYRFCWACKNESHFPSSCHTGTKWLNKCSSEAENISWILAKTKRCPKCHVHIEKNQGCNHMTCRKHAGGCGHEFCWLCKGDWSKHGSATGGYYQCNIYEKNKADGKLSDEQKDQNFAQNELERYEFHYTRFDSHNKSSIHAIKQKESTHEKMHELAQKFQWRLNEAQFLLDAVNEAIQCWHVLAWTYPIAYYLNDKKFNLDLFKEQQAKLENFCDGLQEKLDFDLSKLGDNKTRQEIIGYTRTAQTYRKNLVEYIESDISF